MLILTRKLGESITIGDDIKVTVLGVFGRQVRIGIEAPPKIVVHREEIYLKIQSEGEKPPPKSSGGGVTRVFKIIRAKLSKNP